MTETFDKLYELSKENRAFPHLSDIICSKENVVLALTNLKQSGNSKTAGFDKKTIDELDNKTVDELQQIIISKMMNYKPKPVLLVEIPKSDGKTRPLGIACITDRLFQQCIKQVLEPICEAKFYNYSYGFRPYRTVSQAIARTYFLMQKNKLSYSIDIELDSFYENVNHEILIKLLWNMGIHEKRLLSVLKAMLKAEIILPDKSRVNPLKGCPQAGLLSPLLANVVLNDLDWWIASQWSEFKTRKNYERVRIHKDKAYVDKSNKYTELKRTSNLKEMYIVRYGEDFKIFCRSYSDARKTYEAVSRWLVSRLGISIIPEKSGITNLKQSYTSFLGFRIKLKEKSGKWVVQSHVSDNSIKRIKHELVELIDQIQHSSSRKTLYEKLNQYNATVLGIHQFYCVATDVSIDFQPLGLEMERVVYNRLHKSFRITTTGNFETNSVIRTKYEGSRQMRFINGRPLIPIGYVRTSPPSSKVQEETPFSIKGRALMQRGNEKGINLSILKKMMIEELYNTRIEYHENRISLYCSQKGRCAITKESLEFDDIHCHHKVPTYLGGNDNYDNLIIVKSDVHKLIHATTDETISKYLPLIKDDKQLAKINKLRRLCSLKEIETML